MDKVSANFVNERLENGEQLNIIDVREAEEVAEGKIPGALHIPLSLLEFREHELGKDQSYIMVCRSGGRSGRATKHLKKKGFQASNMTGGMLAWKGSVE